MASRRGNLLLRSKSEVQKNAKAFIFLVVFLPAKSGKVGLLLLGKKGPRGRMNLGAINIFSSCAKNLDQQEIFFDGIIQNLSIFICSPLLHAYTSVSHRNSDLPLINHFAFIEICNDSRWNCI